MVSLSAGDHALVLLVELVLLLLAGVVFAVLAVWGFIGVNDVAEIIAADTTNNVMHAIWRASAW